MSPGSRPNHDSAPVVTSSPTRTAATPRATMNKPAVRASMLKRVCPGVRRRHERPAQVRYRGMLHPGHRIDGFTNLDGAAGFQMRAALGDLERLLHAIG